MRITVNMWKHTSLSHISHTLEETSLRRINRFMFHVGPKHSKKVFLPRFGDISLQERINHKNFELLEAYYKLLSESMPQECEYEMASCGCNSLERAVTSISCFTYYKFSQGCHLWRALCFHRSTVLSLTDRCKRITWNPGPECSHEEEEECGDTVDCWNGEQWWFFYIYLYT